MKEFRIGKTTIAPLPLLATVVLGTAGGFAGHWLGLPLGYLLGSLMTVAFWAIRGWRIAGQPIHLPQSLRMFFIPIVGVGIGGAFTPDIFRDAAGWWPSLLALLAFVPLAHISGYLIYRKGRLDRVTAYFGSAPGGWMESVMMGEEAGADVPLLILIQFLRLILTILFVPLLFAFLTGHAVGSSAGGGAGSPPLEGWDIPVLFLAAVGGYFLGRFLRFPAAIMTGPLAASAFFHLMGITDALPPAWSIIMTQIMVGTGLGARFAGMAASTVRRGSFLALIATTASMVISFVFAVLINLVTGLPLWSVFLAFAPGGITEMGLIALGLQISVVYVVLHHLVRILAAVALMKLMAGRVLGR